MIRVFVADDFQPWHRFVTLALECDPDYKVVGCASDAASVIEQCNLLQPNLILLDTGLPGCDPFSLTQQIRAMLPQTQVILFGHTISPESALKVGAHGFLAKRDAHDLLIAFNTVIRGQYYLSRTTQEMPRPAGTHSDSDSRVLSAKETTSSTIDAPRLFSVPVFLSRFRKLVFQEVWWYVSLFVICCIILSIMATR